jgi:hypothetical protein
VIAQYWEDVAALVRPAPLEDDGVLVWLAAPTTPDGEFGEMASMSLATARNLRDRLNAALNGF